MNNKLTKNQKIFCDEYLIDRNATRAYKVAYPNIKNDATAGQSGSRLLKNVKVKAYLDKKMKVQAERAEISAENTLKGIKTIANANICKLFKSAHRGRGGTYKLSVKSIDEIPEDLQYAISAIKFHKDGTLEVKLCDKMKALELLGKHQALFTENLEVRGYVKAEADINVNPYKDLTTEQLIKLASEGD